MNIILIGYRGAGKTSAANDLSRMLKLPVISTDKEIASRYGEIKDIVAKNGWEHFRKLETSQVMNLDCSETIVDCGGGIVESKENVDVLRRLGRVFWLKASPDVIRKRLGDDDSRPALKSNTLDEIDAVLSKREILYRNACDHVIDTGGRSVKQVAEEIADIARLPNYCAVVAADTLEKTISCLEEAQRKFGLVELRIDHIRDISEAGVRNLMRHKKRQAIVTCRPKEHNGNFSGSETRRIGILKAALDAGADFVDIEYGTDIEITNRVILSYHDFEKTANLRQIYSKLKKQDRAMMKIVTFAKDINDDFKVLDLLSEKKLVSFCMGEGTLSRVLAPKYNSICYAAFGSKVAPGQPSVEEMEIYGISRINPGTKVVGLIGEHTEKSLSKDIHNSHFRKDRQDYVYVPFQVGRKGLGKFMENFRRFGFDGASVTIPFKESIIKHLDSLDKTAEDIGAVNTIVRENNRLIGYNTDCYGAIKAIRDKAMIKGKTCLVIGAGGAARAIAYGLVKEGAHVTIANRTYAKARRVADTFCARTIMFEDIAALIDSFEIVINATSVGMDDDRSIVRRFKPGTVVMDIVYKKGMTEFIKNAESSGCITISGEMMLGYQADEQYRLWTVRR